MFELLSTPVAHVLAEGCGYTEGPAYDPGSGSVFFTSLGGTLHRWSSRGTTTICRTGGGPTGIAIGPEGALYVAQCSGIWGAPSETEAGIMRVDDNVVSPAITSGVGAPNDLCFGSDGRLYFTDPINEVALTKPVPGSVYAYDLATRQRERLLDGLLYPNGLAFSADGEVLYVAETQRNLIHRIQLDGGVPSSLVELEAGPDGMAVDTAGNIWQCVPPADAIYIVAPDGAILAKHDCGKGSFPTNCCFGGPDWTTLYVTHAGRGELAAYKVDVAGLPLYPFRDAACR